ncbi:hypothetical protein BT96DRAFT_1022258 [Gymnopus androsaceus JB14]|uniref:Uncharacterized protein n=1 Tax=Gymnopus androsaceus JB14 TaxID=1447944 RepID=A0A6A4HAS5_9AGAR|nr:hypothetical protein BT96DRAFT_1022258 [Gymnopus androsaceus JB14]
MAYLGVFPGPNTDSSSATSRKLVGAVIMDDVSLCPIDLLRYISDAFAPAHVPRDGAADYYDRQRFKGISDIVLGDLGPKASNTVLQFAEENVVGEDRELLAMADKPVALAINARRCYDMRDR